MKKNDEPSISAFQFLVLNVEDSGPIPQGYEHIKKEEHASLISQDHRHGAFTPKSFPLPHTESSTL